MKRENLLIIGNGPEKELVKTYAENYLWIIYLGTLYRREKALAFKCADCVLMPGQVGLMAIDSLIAKTPIVVRSLLMHGPEIEYIELYTTGVFTELDIADYTSAVISLLSDLEKMKLLTSNCSSNKGAFSVEHMAHSFCDGIKMCLNIPIEA